MEELKTCPFCGKTPSDDVRYAGEIFYVQCINNKCFTEGPSGKTKSKAKTAWNKRIGV